MAESKHEFKWSSDFIPAVLIALIFLFVWPGPFRYEYSLRQPAVKVDRITGNTYVLAAGGWEKASSASERALPAGQLSDIHATKSDYGSGAFVLNLYNGSGWTVSSVTVEMSVGKSTRRYRLRSMTGVAPLASGDMSTALDEEFAAKWDGDMGASNHWKIVEAEGYPTE